MSLYTVITLLIVLSALFGYINTRFIKLPPTIGLMLLALAFSILLQLSRYFLPTVFSSAAILVRQINFSNILLNGMLSFLLFAGSLHTDVGLLHKERRSIMLLSLVGVLLSTFFIGSLLYAVLMLIGIPIAYIYCLLFGALISPTDPIAVLSILTKANVPQKVTTNIVGESLFNDGVGVVVFVTILEVVKTGTEHFNMGSFALLFLHEAGGGLLFGLALGYIMFWLLKSIDDYETELMITIAGVMGGYLLANSLHVSGPLAMVVAGLFTGSRSKKLAMSATTKLYIDKFWELVDVLMNAVLFVLIGLYLMALNFKIQYILVGLLAIPIVLFCRYCSISLPLLFFKKWIGLDKKSVLLMTWGGLRGGLSLAMALSLNETGERNLFVMATYILVLFSIFVQGLTIERLAKRTFGSLSLEGGT